ncbi:hypothetical protein [Kosmotoga olearia]|uniref:Uncharacterized protein n=1 Tax=Kosmotoga olearia (strain ATCC BAA-1733 / DSM 21960 / TBF 19.5.1) TaxID=521045 RepID=C5CHW2_KOSOT|nr:hypothetical protein [Kosmotoga olearia]ACR78817.1 hypothetical protein Kole_0089 [Kosmotoga olearia TBF 19.5.1]MDI3524633.1 hypothetical protein [Kosmotoga sp.]MDK2954417.1 hypothetical protein [Kosmotoga sp.]
MVRKLTFLLIFVIFSSISICQIPSLSNIPQLFKGKYPIPSWIKPGLVTVYEMEGGTRTLPTGQESSAFYGKGYAVFIVTQVENNLIYGLTLFAYDYPGIMVTPPNPMILYGSIYVDPRDIQEILSQREEYERQGIIVKGGQYGEGIRWVNITYKSTSYTIFISEDGKAQKFLFSEKQENGSSVINMQLMGLFYTNCPEIEDFPEAARENHSYEIYSYDPFYTGLTTPAGRETIEFQNIQKPIASYRLSYYTADMMVPISQTINGLPLLGPHYIHPELLNKDTILEIPEINLSWVNEGEDGEIDSIIYFNGQESLRINCDQRGLVTRMQYPFSGFIIITQLER